MRKNKITNGTTLLEPTLNVIHTYDRNKNEIIVGVEGDTVAVATLGEKYFHVGGNIGRKLIEYKEYSKITGAELKLDGRFKN